MLYVAGPGLGVPGAPPWGKAPGAPAVAEVTVLVLTVAATAACKKEDKERNSEEVEHTIREV